MARILISTLPRDGHVNPALPLAARLVADGHQVLWHTGSRYAARVWAAGAVFTPLDHTPDTERGATGRGLTAAETLVRLFVEPVRGQARDYAAILARFPADLIVADACGGALALRGRGGPPFATLGITPLVMRSPEPPAGGRQTGSPARRLDRPAGRLRRWVAAHAFARQATAAFAGELAAAGGAHQPGKTIFELLVSPYLHLQCSVRGFEYPRAALPPTVRFVGAMDLPAPAGAAALPEWWPELAGDRPVVLVTQGTVATAASALLRPTIEALADEPLLVVALAAGQPIEGAPPANLRVASHIPYPAILPRVAAMVTNGGYGGVQMALARGVPLVVAGATEDKADVAARVAWSGAGINLRTAAPGAARIAAAVRTVLGEPRYRQAARRLAAEFASHDAPAEAARLLERLAATGAPVT